ncbi:DUF742 domain-containing protein [Streptomyces sp. NPDC006997]|uniref:DUF742 domain-containing protein n=1 Tax=Streptomyces sp. NPDC006997 TaxID=3155356 RepID=UPI0033C8F8D3
MTPPKRQRRHPRKEEPPPQQPPEPREDDGDDSDDSRPEPERLFVIGGDGDGDGGRGDVDLVTLVVAHAEPRSSTPPEQAAVLRLCVAPLSVAEISAYLALPFSVVSVLLTDMLTAGLVQARAPIVRQALPDRSILEAVMHGLQKL